MSNAMHQVIVGTNKYLCHSWQIQGSWLVLTEDMDNKSVTLLIPATSVGINDRVMVNSTYGEE